MQQTLACPQYLRAQVQYSDKRNYKIGDGVTRLSHTIPTLRGLEGPYTLYHFLFVASSSHS